MSQYDKILGLYKNAEWRCQVDFWNIYIRSPHKRRKEMLKLGYSFEERPCEHGVERSKDYKLVKVEIPPVPVEPKGLNILYKVNENGKVWTL